MGRLAALEIIGFFYDPVGVGDLIVVGARIQPRVERQGDRAIRCGFFGTFMVGAV